MITIIFAVMLLLKKEFYFNKLQYLPLKHAFLIIFLTGPISLSAQAPVDTLQKNTHSVKRATNLSALLPGAGQIYNHKVWKVPVIYAAFGGMAYLIKFNNDNYKTFHNALRIRLDNDSTTIDNYANQYTDDNLRTLSDYYHRNRDLSIIVTALIYFLNIIDAHVDAHLYTFNVDDNLSLRIDPVIIKNSYSSHASTLPGIGLNLNF